MQQWLTRRTELRKILSVILILHAGFIFLWWTIVGPSYFMGLSETALFLALNAVLVTALYAMSAPTRPVLLSIALFFLLFVHIRVTSYLILPSTALGFPSIEPFTSEEIRQGLTYILFGTVALLLGVQATARLTAAGRRRQHTSIPDLLQHDFVTIGGLALLWVLALGINFVAEPYIHTGYLPAQIGWFVRLFNIDIALIITLAWLVARKDAPPVQWWIAVAFVVIWLCIAIMGGSRGGAMRIAMILFMVLAVRHAIQSVSPRAFMLGVVAMMVVSVVTGFTGHIFRMQHVGVENPLESTIHDMTRQDIYSRLDSAATSGQPTESDPAVTEGSTPIMARRAVDQEDTILFDTSRWSNPILGRLGIIDFGLQVLTRDGDQEIIDRYLRSSYALKNIANALVIGDVFDGIDISTAQVFTIAYRDYDEEHARQYYLSEPWTIWGWAKVTFGGMGGIAVLLFAGVVLQGGWTLLQALPDSVGLYFKTAYLFVFAYPLINMFGIDHVVMLGIHVAISMSSALALLLLVSLATRRWRLRTA